MKGTVNGSDVDIARLTDELRRIVDRIGSTAPADISLPKEQQEAKSDYPALAEAMLAARQRISRHFPPILFADPARDMLLDLYVSGARGRPVFVSSACIAASVPATTALRWIKKLQLDGLLELAADSADNRRVLVWLTAKATLQMEAYLGDVATMLKPLD